MKDFNRQRGPDKEATSKEWIASGKVTFPLGDGRGLSGGSPH